MAREELTIQKYKARLKTVGVSYPETPTTSGDGEDITQYIIEILDELDIPLPPDIDPEDWDDIPIVIGLDDDGDPELIYVDPDTEELTEWPLDDLDWEDFLDKWDLDDGDLRDLEFVAPLDGLDLDVWVDTDFHIHTDDLPASIAVVFPPNKTEYSEAQVISIAGLYVYAYDADGHVWRGTGKFGDKYRSGRVPNEELMIDPKIAEYYEGKTLNGNVGANQVFATIAERGSRRVYNKSNNNDPSFGGAYLRNNMCYDPILVSTTAAGTGYNWSNGAHPVKYNGATYYWASYGGFYQSSGGHIESALATLGGPMSAEAAAIQMLSMAGAHGSDVAGEMTINVNWLRPGDGAILSTSFTIQVKEGGGGGR